MKKKILLILLSAIMVNFAFANGQNGETSTEPVELSIWVPGPGTQEDSALLLEANRDYAGKKIGAYPKITFTKWAEWFDKKRLMIASGEEFDIAFTAVWNDFEQEVSREAWVPLNDLIDEHAPDIRSAVGNWLKAPVKDGKIYAVPTVKEGATSPSFIYNDKYVQKYDVPIDKIKTAADLTPWLQLILDNEPGVIPFLVTDGPSNLSDAMAMSMENVGPGRKYHLVDGKVVYKWNNDQMWGYAENMYEWYKAGFFQPEALDSGDPALKKYHTDGNWFAFIHVGHPGKASQESSKFGYKFVKGVDIAPPMVDKDTYLGSMLAISVNSNYPVESIKCIELMNTDKYFNNLNNYGIEGKHYTFADEKNGVIEFIPDSGYFPNMTWVLQNQFLTYITTADPIDIWDQYKKYNDSAELYSTVGFFPDLEPVKTQVAAVDALFDMYRVSVERGVIDPNTIRDKYQSELQDAGILDIEAELQKQVDAFLASK